MQYRFCPALPFSCTESSSFLVLKLLFYQFNVDKQIYIFTYYQASCSSKYFKRNTQIDYFPDMEIKKMNYVYDNNQKTQLWIQIFINGKL